MLEQLGAGVPNELHRRTGARGAKHGFNMDHGPYRPYRKTLISAQGEGGWYHDL